MQATSAKLALKLRIPSWADEARGASVLVNGEPWEGCQAAAGHMAGSHCTVERDFRAGAEQLPRILSSPASFSHHDHFRSRTGSHESAQCQKIGVRVALMCVISAGDTIAMTLPMSVRAERVQDSRANYSSLHVCCVILLCCCTRTAPHSQFYIALHMTLSGIGKSVCNTMPSGQRAHVSPYPNRTVHT